MRDLLANTWSRCPWTSNRTTKILVDFSIQFCLDGDCSTVINCPRVSLRLFRRV
ncbi:hypothetical protein P167DRAFT_343401 [Morchella conica CCBAS932]|uniref:Uncharacterized protein n=1 Tax=Morchella conica CCBAS932 TaxID=1392247 RepID=A0A3N4KD81_9PEZI|nr:hypothetical protein P167DRAFT_343401 [Morchella conica CCBAS932]